MQTATHAKIKVFWQPGCSSCLRTKEFLTKQGIEFESIDVHNDPDGAEQLAALGARSVPVVALGGKYTFCQSINDVIKFLDLKTKIMTPLPPAELVSRLELVLESNARYTRQFSGAAYREPFRIATGRRPGSRFTSSAWPRWVSRPRSRSNCDSKDSTKCRPPNGDRRRLPHGATA